ncbi:TPA: hypothetical protein ACWON6_005246, partial [Klebsiella pneumoniae]
RETGLQARTQMIDMEQITEPCIINGHYTHSEAVLSELYSVITRHIKAGVKLDIFFTQAYCGFPHHHVVALGT